MNRVLCLAGFDPSCAAGIARDLRTLEAWGIAADAVPTCWTVQIPTTFERAEPVAPRLIDDTLSLLTQRCMPAAVKVGLVADVGTWNTLLPWLERFAEAGIPIVVDPVRGPSAGGFEVGEGCREVVATRASSLGAILTPNVPELAWLTDETDEATAAQTLLTHGASGVLVKGGHRSPTASDTDDDVFDCWFDNERQRTFHRPRLPEPRPRGTGCALSSLLTALLAEGRAPADAAREAGHALWNLEWLAKGTP